MQPATEVFSYDWVAKKTRCSSNVGQKWHHTLDLCSSVSNVMYSALFCFITESVGMGRMFMSVRLFVCLFVWSINKKQIIPKCSNLVYGNDLGISWKWYERSKVRVNKCIFHTKDYYAYVNAHLTDHSNMAWFWTLWVPSGFVTVFIIV